MKGNPEKKRRVLLNRELEGKPARALPVPTSTPRNTDGMVTATGWWDNNGGQPEQLSGGSGLLFAVRKHIMRKKVRTCLTELRGTSALLL